MWIWWSSQRSFYFKLTKNRKHKCKVFVVQVRDFFSIQIMKFDLFLVSCVVNTILCLFIIIIFLWSKASNFDLLNVDRHSTKKKSVISNLLNLKIEGNLLLFSVRSWDVCSVCVVFVMLAMIPHKSWSEQNIFTIIWWMWNVSKLQKCISMVNYINFFFWIWQSNLFSS